MDMGPAALWQSMGLVARLVVIILAFLSVYSIARAGERYWKYHTSKKQSLEFALLATKHLQQNRPDDAIADSKKFKKAHLAKVVAAGLLEFKTTAGQGSPGGDYDVVEAASRAIERETLLTTADFKRGLGGIATIGVTAPFIGLFGTVVGIINAFRGMAISGSGGLAAVSAGIAEALVTTALGLFVAIPAVWFFNYFQNQIETFQVEMTNSSSELIDFFLKTQGGSHGAATASR
jgi:biopolymer transport protein ExbB